MIELALMLRAIQSSFMVYKWTMAIQILHRPRGPQIFGEDIKAIAVEGAIWPQSSNWMPRTGCLALQDGGVCFEH